jgi:putative membrane protein
MNTILLNHAPAPLRYLSIAYLGVMAFSIWQPASFSVWVAEIIPALIIFSAIWLISASFHFSTFSYGLMFVWLILHTIGAKYTFAEVPFDWFNQLIGAERNHFDRVAHFSIGFYAFPITEYLIRQRHCGGRLATLVGLFSIMSLAASYEIIEWWYAALAGGDAGIAFLGSQGDIWDAQKDMLCDTLGAISVLLVLPSAIRMHFWVNTQRKPNP